jgi:pilus assembly protein Flp/PilA
LTDECDLRPSSATRSYKVIAFLKRFRHDEAGATAIEYGLIASLIAAAIVTLITAVGSHLNTTFSAIGKAMP